VIDESSNLRPWRRGLMAFGFWSIIGLSFAIQLYLTRSELGLPVTWRYAIGRNLVDWYVFALLSVPALWLARRIPIERADWGRRVTIHAAASAVFSLGWMALRALVVSGRVVTFTEAFTHALVATFFFNVAVYCVVAGYGHTVNYYRKFQERELRASELETRLAQARLQALQMQLNPHFLFNTLNSVSSLIRTDPMQARVMVIRLSKVLRRLLRKHEHYSPLRDELSFIEDYLAIEVVRFGDKLRFERDVAPDTLDMLVPSMLLQPLVENSVKHGLGAKVEGGTIRIRTWRTESRLCLTVEDDGVGIPEAKLATLLDGGIGVNNVHERLKVLFGHDYRMWIESQPGMGVRIQIEVPELQPSLVPA
jgi:signal transduction histidine kinase